MRKNKLSKTFLRNPSEKNKTEYKKYKNKLNHIIKMAKKIYYEEQLVKYKYDARMTWKTLNEIMNRNKVKKGLPEEFVGNNPYELIKDPLILANKFNEYFVNVGPELAKKITENDGQKTFEHYLTSNLYKDSMFLEAITKIEIEL